MSWKGGFDKGFTRDEFVSYCSKLVWIGWRPQFVVVHNTGAPNLAQWKATPGGEAQRIKNFEHYYKNQQHWSSGPHLFIGIEKIWLGTPLTTSGTHSPSFNSISLGVEIAGDYDHDTWEGPVRENAIAALTALHAALGLDPATMKLHKEDPRTTHDCPGRNIVKAELIEAVKRALIREGEHAPLENSPPPTPEATYVVKTGDTLWGIGHRFGVPVADLIKLNGDDPLKIGEILKFTDQPPPPTPAPQEGASSGGAVKTSANGVKFIAVKEAFVSVVYMDGPTPAIGFGHNDKMMDRMKTITIEEGLALQAADLAPVEAAILKAVKVPLKQHEFDALASWMYNLGVGVIGSASLIPKLNSGDRQGAADGLLKWNKVRGVDGLTPSPGLTKRREAERTMFLTGDYGDLSTYLSFDGDPKTTKPVRKTFPT